jgi:hypothetical protein
LKPKDRQNARLFLRQLLVPEPQRSRMSVVRWLDSKPFAQQIILLSAVLDPVGIAGGYLLGPRFDLEPIMGAVAGAVAASTVVSLWILRYQQRHA